MADELSADRPSWLPENFQNPEALVDSYKEAVREMHATKQELAAYKRASHSDSMADLAMATPPEPADRATNLQAGLEALTATYDDIPEKLPLMNQIIKERPELMPTLATSNPTAAAVAWESVYNLASTAMSRAQAEQVQAQAAQQSDAAVREARHQAKLAAVTMSGAGVRQPALSEREQWAKQITEANRSLGGFSTL